MFHVGHFDYQGLLEFYDELYNELKLPAEIRRKIDRENILMLMN
jgi:hypothetical protein